MRVTASNIIHWVENNNKEAQTQLPRLIRRLCAACGKAKALAFPAGDSTFVPGIDGYFSTDLGNTWVPQGDSYWEFGCDQKPQSKATGDYKKRVKKIAPSARASATFVFITPRRWLKKAEWAETRRKTGEWKDVRAYDADDLEQWLENTPAVALQFAAELGLQEHGLEDFARYWECWCNQSAPKLTIATFTKYRESVRDVLLEQIRKQFGMQAMGLLFYCNSRSARCNKTSALGYNFYSYAK